MRAPLDYVEHDDTPEAVNRSNLAAGIVIGAVLLFLGFIGGLIAAASFS